MITYYLFFYGRPESNKKTVEKYKVVGDSGGGIAAPWIPGYNNYGSNSYDLNDLSLTKPKNNYPINIDVRLFDNKKVKYLKSINSSLDQIRLLVNKDKETKYNLQTRNPTPINNKPDPFMFVAKYLVEKLNHLSRNLYKVTFVKFISVSGEEIDEQYKVDLEMQFSTIIRKESHTDKNAQYLFNVKTEAVINKPDRYGTKGSMFFRTLFLDDKEINNFLPYNI